MTKITKKLISFAVVAAMAVSFSIAAFASEVEWGGYAKNNTHNAVTDAYTPKAPAKDGAKAMAGLKWVYELRSSSTWDAISEPILAGGHIYIAVAAKLLKIEAETGTLAASVDLTNAIDYGAKPVYANGMIIVAESKGVLEAIDCETMSSVWATEALADAEQGAHQSNSTVTYSNGCIFFGTTVADFEKSYSGTFFCVNVSTGEVIWKYENTTAGYYWSGAVVMNGSAIVASDDGNLVAFNRENGEVKSTIALGAASRGTVSTDGTNVYVTTTNGSLHKVVVNADGTLGEDSSVSFAASSTGTATFDQGLLFVGGASADYTGVLAVIDAQTMTVKSSLQLSADVKSAPLVSSFSGNTYVYFTVNNTPGAVYMTNSADSFATVQTAYEPETENQNYCMASVMADSEGSLYYTNDSGKLFKIKSLNRGDLNADNMISLADVMTAARAVSSGDIESIPDLSGDDKVGIADVLVLARYTAGNLSVF